MSRARESFAATLFLVTLAGCKDAPSGESERAHLAVQSEERAEALAARSEKEARVVPKEPVEKTPDGVKLSWKAAPGSAHDLTVENTEATGSFMCFYTLECKVGVNGLPKGAKVAVANSEAVSDGIRSVTLKLDLGDALREVAPAMALAADKAVDPKQKLTITFPDGVKLASDLPSIPVDAPLQGELRKLNDGKPVLFGKESIDDKPAQHAILFPFHTQPGDALIRSAKTMHEVDLVAIERPLPPRSGNKRCAGYRAVGETGPGRELDLELVDWEVRLIERRTAKVVETKKFEADPLCPLAATNNKATSYPSADAVKVWLLTKRG